MREGLKSDVISDVTFCRLIDTCHRTEQRAVCLLYGVK